MRHRSFCFFVAVVMLCMSIPALFVGAHLAVWCDTFFVLPLPVMVVMGISLTALGYAERG